MFGWKWKSGGMEKMCLFKFTHIPLLKNDAPLKQKSDKKKKKQSPKFIKKNKKQKQKQKKVKEKKKVFVIY